MDRARVEALAATVAGQSLAVKAFTGKTLRSGSGPWGRLHERAHPSYLHTPATPGSLPARLRGGHVHPRDGRALRLPRPGRESRRGTLRGGPALPVLSGLHRGAVRALRGADRLAHDVRAAVPG